jgi:hypothetical protein
MLFAEQLKSYLISRLYGRGVDKIENPAIILAAKRRSRAQKGNEQFNCFMTTEEQLFDIIKQLKQTNLHQKNSTKSRTQVLVKIKDSYHYTYVDIQNDCGNLSFFILDAAGTADTSLFVDKLKQIHRQERIYFCPQRIQKDGESCFYFSLSHAETFSKIDWHEQLAEMSSSGKLQNWNKENYYLLERPHLPLPAFKQSHHLSIGKKELSERQEAERQQIVNKHNESLEQHLKRHETPPKKVNVNGVTSTIDNGYIAHKIQSYQQLIERYIDGHYGELSLFDYFKEHYSCFSMDSLAAQLGAQEPRELSEMEWKSRFLLDAIRRNSPQFPILEAVFSENPDIHTEIAEDTPIFCEAVRNGDLEALECLASKGISVDQQDPLSGLAPVHIIVKEVEGLSQQVQLLAFLKNHNANLLAIDPQGKNILDYLTNRKDEDYRYLFLQSLIEIEPRFAQEYPDILNMQPKNSLIPLLGDKKKILSCSDLLKSLASIDTIGNKLAYLEKAFEVIKYNPGGLYSTRTKKHLLQSHNESYSDRQLNDIHALKLAYCNLVKSALADDNVDKHALAEITENSCLIDFNRTCYRFFVKKTTNSRQQLDVLLAPYAYSY